LRLRAWRIAAQDQLANAAAVAGGAGELPYIQPHRQPATWTRHPGPDLERTGVASRQDRGKVDLLQPDRPHRRSDGGLGWLAVHPLHRVGVARDHRSVVWCAECRRRGYAPAAW